MNSEEAKHLSDVLKAYSEGKKIEVRFRRDMRCDMNWGDWEEYDGKKYAFISTPTAEWRIKEEPKYRPYTNAEEFLIAQKEHGCYIKEKRNNFYTIPWNICDKGVDIIINSSKSISFGYLLADYTWQDGTPCGVMEK